MNVALVENGTSAADAVVDLISDEVFWTDGSWEEHPWLEPWRQLTLGAESPCRLLLGRVDGVFVSCSLAFLHKSSVGL